MGIVKLTYQIKSITVPVPMLINDIERGITFILDYDGERTVFPPQAHLSWIKNWSYDSSILSIAVDDDFLPTDSVFEKLFTTFVFNLMDFGEIFLQKIDFSESNLLSYAPSSSRELFNSRPVLGTIFKPYYQPLKEKINMGKKFAEANINVIKEDETYLMRKSVILNEAICIQRELPDQCQYIPNITSHINDYSFIEELLKSSRAKILMVDFLVAGLGNIFKMKKEFPEAQLWGHRVGFSAFQNFISVEAISTLAVFAGIDYLHIGTPVTERQFSEKRIIIDKISEMRNFKAVFTKTSDTLAGDLVKRFDSKAVYMACGYFRNELNGELEYKKVIEWVERALKNG